MAAGRQARWCGTAALVLVLGVTGCAFDYHRTWPDGSRADHTASPRDGGTDGITLRSVGDDTFADFSQGTLSESGAKIYVSARGNVQLLDRLDLNRDGYPDLVFSNSYDGKTPAVDAYVYWGAAAGFSGTSRSALPVLGAHGALSADLNDDGLVDLVFANHIGADGSFEVDSYIYWGSSGGYAAAKRTGLPTAGAHNVMAADLDRDGHLDLIFSNYASGTSTAIQNETSSFIYWGSAAGFSPSRRTALPTMAAVGGAIADLDRDGHLDLVFGSFRDAKAGSHATHAAIYWGDKGKYTTAARTLVPGWLVYDVAVADLNGDGHPDLVLGSQAEDSAGTATGAKQVFWGDSTRVFAAATAVGLPRLRPQSVSIADLDRDGHLDLVFGDAKVVAIYPGSASGYGAASRIELPAAGAHGNTVADYDGDGWPDLAVSNYGTSPNHAIDAYVYWGAKGGFSATRRTGLPTLAPAVSVSTDPGSVAARKPAQTFTSRTLDTGLSSPSYVHLRWWARLPNKTGLRFQVRAADDPTLLESSAWLGPDAKTSHYAAGAAQGSVPLNPALQGGRYVQYRAELSGDEADTPVLDRVAITFR